MATRKKILAFRVEVEGVSKEAEKLANIEIELSKLNEERKEAIALSKTDKKNKDVHIATLAKVISKTKDLQVQKSALNKTQRLTVQTLKAETGSMEQLRRRTAQLRDQANKLNTTTREGQRALVAKRREIIANTKRIRDYDRALSGSSTLVGEYSRGIVSSFRAISGGIIAAVAVVRTFQRVIGGSVKNFAEFETSIVNVQTLLDETDELLATRSIAIMRQYGLEIQDTNKAMFDAISAGVKTGESYQFMNTAARLAIGGVTDISSAVDGLTSIMNAYGLQAAEAEKIASAFFTAQKFGKTTVAELSENIGQVAPVANLANVSYQELLSTYAELTKQGINTQLANTAIKATILAVIKPSEQARAKFKQLGIETGLLAVKEQGLFTILEKVSKAAEKDADSLTELIPNVRALTGVGALGEEQLEDYHKILETVNTDFGDGSSLMEAYNLQMETANKRWDLAKTRVRELSQELGGRLAPALLTVLEALLPYTTEDPALLAAENIQIFSQAIKDLDRESQIQQVVLQIQAAEESLRGFRVEAQELDESQTFLKGIFSPKAWEEADRQTQFLNDQIIPQLEMGLTEYRRIYDELISGTPTEAPPAPGGEGGDGVTGGAGITDEARKAAQALQVQALKMQKFYEQQFEVKKEKQQDALELQQEAIDAELEAIGIAADREIEIETKKWDSKEVLRQKFFEKEKAELLRKQEIYNTFSDAVIQITNESIAQGELTMQKFGEIVIVSALDLLRKIILMKQAEILVKALASPESIATFGIAGIAKAALINGLVTAAFGAVKSAVAGKEEGGVIARGNELPGSPRTGDNTLILAKPGEVVLNERQQAAIGGHEVFQRAGVPGFAAGGVPDPITTRLDVPDIAGDVAAGLRRMDVVLNMHEVREANDELDVTVETTGV